jgi:hypothetical protein
MKILDISDFVSERMKVMPITNDEMDKVGNVDFDVIDQKNLDEQIERDIRLIEKGIDKYCTYRSLGMNGVPNNAGELLVKYGKDHGYQIRDKEWDVNPLPIGIVIEWITQETDETDGANISGMFTELIRKIGIDPIYDILLLSDVRDDYSPSDMNYRFKYMFRYNSDSEEFERVTDNEYDDYIYVA